MSDLTFLPWLRRGLASGLSTAETGQAEFDRSPDIDVWVEIDGETASSSVRLRPADHVSGLAPDQIARRYPAPGAREVETGYWPVIEFSTADLPWAMTPLAPDGSAHDRLRPWLALICTAADEMAFTAAEGQSAATVTVDASLLADPADAPLWGHVQSTVAADATAAAADGTGVLSRLVAPVTLQPSTTYRVALVPTFVAGNEITFRRAWANDSGPVTLRAFDTWTFTTGVASTFQELVGLLGPVPPSLDIDLGIRAVDITAIGGVDPWPEEQEVSVDYAGALVDTDLDPSGLGTLRDDFQAQLIPLLDLGTPATLEPDSDDPVVAPPLYGAFATDLYTVPHAGWRRIVNLTPRHRMSAGLGAAIVRTHQERFMAAAWEQAGDVIAARQALNASRLQAEIARTWKLRADQLDDDQHAAVLRAQYTTVRSAGNVAARAALRWSGIPNGLFDPSLTRITRRGTAAARAVDRRSRPTGDDGPPRPTIAVRGRLAATLGEPEARARIGFGRVDAPRGAIMSDHRRVTPNDIIEGMVDPWTGTGATRFTADHPDDVRLSGIALRARTTIAPMIATRARIEARIAGLTEFLANIGWPSDEIPTRIKFGPRLDEALVWSLIDESPELVVPGVGDFPDNAVRMVEANGPFVAAFLAGANHEMSREMLWREYPADMGSTTFHRFWERPIGQDDVVDMADWPAGHSLAQIAEGGRTEGATVVVLARGDVFRLYPTMAILLRNPSGQLEPPMFGGTIPPATRFFAFDVASRAEIFAGGWRVRFQEQLTEPRFGLDPGQSADTRNGAHFAASTYQPPFAQEFDVIDIIGEDDR